ncbi:hypothetical protein KQ718_17740, partial [Listeria monocytogenes]|nr:hypothetical protein [Listeria monocytogenes]
HRDPLNHLAASDKLLSTSCPTYRVIAAFQAFKPFEDEESDYGKLSQVAGKLFTQAGGSRQET